MRLVQGHSIKTYLKNSWAEDLYVILRKLSEERIYAIRNLRLEIAGYTTLTYLLDSFVPSLVSYDTNRQLDYVELKKIGIISESQKRSYHYFAEGRAKLKNYTYAFY